MMDSAALSRDSASSLSSISNERTVRLGAAHGDAKDIGLLFFSPQKELAPVEAPPLFTDFSDDLPAEMEAAYEEEPEVEAKPRASWLDALASDDHHTAAGERVSAFNPDDNGLYRMFLPETV
jgi:hypothetical protein